MILIKRILSAINMILAVGLWFLGHPWASGIFVALIWVLLYIEDEWLA
jgi:protein-S-isoprenylcysteine O-methyltransferase Ste14